MEMQKLTENERLFENRIAVVERKTTLSEERYKMAQETSDERQKMIQAQFSVIQTQFNDLRELILQVKESNKQDFVTVRKSITDLDEKFTWKFKEVDRRFDEQIKIMKSEFIWPVIITGGSLFVASWFAPLLNKWLASLLNLT